MLLTELSACCVLTVCKHYSQRKKGHYQLEPIYAADLLIFRQIVSFCSVKRSIKIPEWATNIPSVRLKQNTAYLMVRGICVDRVWLVRLQEMQYRSAS